MDLKNQNYQSGMLLFEMMTGSTNDTVQGARSRARLEEEVVSAIHVNNGGSKAQVISVEAWDWIKSVDTPIFGVDTQGYIAGWNDKMAEITGHPAQEMLALDVNSFIGVANVEAFLASVTDAVKGLDTAPLLADVLTRNQGTISLRFKLSAQRDREIGGVVGVVCFTEVIPVDTSLCEGGVHAPKRLVVRRNSLDASQTEDALRSLVNSTSAPIIGVDHLGRVNEWNSAAVNVTGYTKEEAMRKNFLDTFIDSSLRGVVQLVFDNAVNGQSTANYELDFNTKYGGLRHLLVSVSALSGSNGGTVLVAQDVTEITKHDRAVAAMANELRKLIDTANSPIFGMDVDGDVNEWNAKTTEVTGYTKEEAFDEKLVKKFIVKSQRKSVQKILDKAIKGQETSNYELQLRTKSKEIRYLLVNATTRRDPENNVVGVVGMAQDITEDKKHAEELRELDSARTAQEAKVETERNMTAYFAHELRNPLGAIDSALCSMPDDLPVQANELVAAMRRCTSFMSSIMNNLLDVRKMEEGKMALKAVPISLTELLDSIHKMLSPSVKEGVEFRQKANTKGKDWILGDSHRIQQVMTNVITNAIKYTLEGSITLTVEWEGDNVKFECADTGPGIPVSQQKVLFERFVQRGGAPGTGLGLAIAKNLVDLAGGSIRFISDPSVRRGTSCVVLLPLPLCDPPEDEKKREEENTELIEEPLRILIVDDIKMNRLMLKRRFQKGVAPKATVSEAATGEESLVICATQHFDVIVVDQYMEEAGGVMVGTDVVFAMRRMRIEATIIGCSGNDMDDQFMDAGADLVWKKPMPSNAKIISDLRKSLAK